MSDSHLDWTLLGSDLTALILSHLPIASIIRATAVCKLWRSIISTPSFSNLLSTSAHHHPWFFLLGQSNILLKNNQSFAFDPDSNLWLPLPHSLLFPPPHYHHHSLIGSNGLVLSTTSSSRFLFSPILSKSWHLTSPLRFPRSNPLVGVFSDGSGSTKFIVVGGVRFIGGLVDIEDRLDVEIYTPNLDAWELCPPLPVDFRSGNSSQWLCSALYKGKFYVFGIYSCFISAFHLTKHFWTEVQTLRPPGVSFSFLIACRDQLVLAGLCNSPRGPSVNLWRVDEETMEFSEIAIMPQDLLYKLFDGYGDDKFASLKCVGLGNLIYVFNEEYHKSYPACVCEINSGTGKCSWRRIPHLPKPVNQFHKVFSFCSTIPLGNILRIGEEEIGA